MSAVSSYFAHIVPGVVNPSPSRPRVRILLRPFGNFGNFLYPTLPVSFVRDTKSSWSLLSGVYARGSKISHYSALEMCNLSWTPPPTLRDHTSSWTTLEISLKTFVCYPVNMMCSKSNQNQHPHFCYMQYVLVFLSNRPTLCSICHCWLDHSLIHIVFQLDEYLFVA